MPGASAAAAGQVGTVLAGLALLLVLYLIIVAVAGHSPGPFLRKIREVQLLAFSTSSCAAPRGGRRGRGTQRGVVGSDSSRSSHL